MTPVVTVERRSATLPEAMPGFEHLRRFWDPTQGRMVVRVLPGEFYVSGSDELVSTVLGSCVSACIHDAERGVGGMNHFMLPEPTGERANLRVKVFGGGRVLAQLSDVGQRNIDFVHRYIEAERLQLAAEDLGDVYPRQVQFFPHSGRVRVRQLRRSDDVALVADERGYLKRLANDPIKGEVELF